MQNWISQFEWNFPLGMIGVVFALIAAILLTALSYHFIPRTIKSGSRATLIAVRFTFFSILIFCLCRPTMTRRQTIREQEKKSIAVLIDDSSSMTRKALSGETRFNRACRFWERKLKPHSDQYDFKFYQFNQSIRPVEEFRLETAPDLTFTRLYRNICEWNDSLPAQGIDGIICMTDGVDSSEETSTAAIDALSSSITPHVFIPITSAVTGPPAAAFRKLEVDPVAKLNTRVPVTLVTATSGEKETLLSILEDKTEIYQEAIPSSGSTATRTHTFDLSINRAGVHRYSAQIRQEETILAQTEWSVEGTADDYTKVLLYQGGLDWGTRYFRSVFDRDNRSELTVAFAPDSFPALMSSDRNETLFPNIDELSAYDVVIILKMRQEQIAAGMEDTLREFVSTGGSLLFMIANTLDAQAYIGSSLETFLPVEFESVANAASYDENTAKFLESMNSYRSASRAIQSTQHDGSVETRLNPPSLYPFQLTEEGRRSPVFSYLIGDNAEKSLKKPAFQDFALVKKSKHGARVLAVHPELTVNGEQRIILAQQQFGEGQVAMLATDPLWRWKLTNKSSDPSFDEFWKGFMAWLGAGHIHTSYWDIPWEDIQPDTPMDCIFIVSTRDRIPTKKTLYAMLTDTTTGAALPLHLVPVKNKTQYKTSFTPIAGHSYQLSAFGGIKQSVKSYFSCPVVATGHKELQQLKPNIEILRRLAASSFQHEVVQTDQNRDWTHWIPEETAVQEPVKAEFHLWHKPWVFILMLTLFLAELIIRRLHKLV